MVTILELGSTGFLRTLGTWGQVPLYEKAPVPNHKSGQPSCLIAHRHENGNSESCHSRRKPKACQLTAIVARHILVSIPAMGGYQ